MVRSDLVLELKKVELEFEGQKILNETSLKVYSGQALVLIGPSGHGKSVLMKILAGLIEPSRGQALVYGQDWKTLRGAQRIETLRDIGMLFQKNALFDSMTCSQNVAFALRENSDLDESRIQLRVDQFLEAVGILHAKDLLPDEISGGMQKRLGIARALSLDPKLIFYDDPTAGLDPITSRKIIDLILEHKQRRKSTAVVITNDMNRAYQLVKDPEDEIMMVVEGEALRLGSSQEARENPDLRVQQFILGKREGPLGPLNQGLRI